MTQHYLVAHSKSSWQNGVFTYVSGVNTPHQEMEAYKSITGM